MRARRLDEDKPGGREGNYEHEKGARIGGGIAVVEDWFEECGASGEASDFVKEDIREEMKRDGSPEGTGFEEGGREKVGKRSGGEEHFDGGKSAKAREVKEAEDERGKCESGTETEAIGEHQEEVAAEDEFLAEVAPEKHADGVEGIRGGEVAWLETEWGDEPEAGGDQGHDQNCAEGAEDQAGERASRRFEAEG